MVVAALLSVDLVESVDLVSVDLVVNCNSWKLWGFALQKRKEIVKYVCESLKIQPASLMTAISLSFGPANGLIKTRLASCYFKGGQEGGPSPLLAKRTGGRYERPVKAAKSSEEAEPRPKLFCLQI